MPTDDQLKALEKARYSFLKAVEEEQWWDTTRKSAHQALTNFSNSYYKAGETTFKAREAYITATLALSQKENQ